MISAGQELGWAASGGRSEELATRKEEREERGERVKMGKEEKEKRNKKKKRKKKKKNRLKYSNECEHKIK